MEYWHSEDHLAYSNPLKWATEKNHLTNPESMALYHALATQQLQKFTLSRLKLGMRLFNSPTDSANGQIVNLEGFLGEKEVDTWELDTMPRHYWRDYYENGRVHFSIHYGNSVPPSHKQAANQFFSGCPDGITYSISRLS